MNTRGLFLGVVSAVYGFFLFLYLFLSLSPWVCIAGRKSILMGLPELSWHFILISGLSMQADWDRIWVIDKEDEVYHHLYIAFQGGQLINERVLGQGNGKRSTQIALKGH